ncbi:hypothetical protein [Bacillus sp. WMMC1349]|uniref:hypothetical protein n=1 Tax=Bacillus sp. WMMC1349 TaxID=2736254 RepID=UPI001C1312AC|nr:hypothetical protein [Bacillus sp. WMMC1349]
MSTRKFVAGSLRDGALKTTGTDIDKILPPVSRFGGRGGVHVAKKQSVIEKLMALFISILVWYNQIRRECKKSGYTRKKYKSIFDGWQT